MRVEIRIDGAYLSYETIQGAAGLPVGTSGKGMLMLSGGIDSPVAGYFAMKRGVEIEAVHFASPPYTSEQALQKAKDLTKKLAPYVGSIQFIEVPFTEIQEEIKNRVPQGYWMTITRRMMLRLTDAIREARHGLIILNGESLGQVASQTLHSMVAINEVTNTPIVRPVATMDKLEIIEVAEAIDTFELSVQPFEDCCTIFAPPQPKTRPRLDKVHQYEERLDIEGMMERAMAGLKLEAITANQEKQQRNSLNFYNKTPILMLRPQLFLNICGRFSSSERVCEYFLAIENGTCYTQYVNHLTRRVDRMEALRDKNFRKRRQNVCQLIYDT